MARMIFVNLPVTELARAKAFYEALGFTNNAQFSDDDSACMVVSETINVMLLTHSKWRGFTSRPIPTDMSGKRYGWIQARCRLLAEARRVASRSIQPIAAMGLVLQRQVLNRGLNHGGLRDRPDNPWMANRGRSQSGQRYRRFDQGPSPGRSLALGSGDGKEFGNRSGV